MGDWGRGGGGRGCCRYELKALTTWMICTGYAENSFTVNKVVNCAGIFEQSMGARNQVGIGFSYRPARLHRLAESIPGNRFMGSIVV